jgi:hypothetical protein
MRNTRAVSLPVAPVRTLAKRPAPLSAQDIRGELPSFMAGGVACCPSGSATTADPQPV